MEKALLALLQAEAAVGQQPQIHTGKPYQRSKTLVEHIKNFSRTLQEWKGPINKETMAILIHGLKSLARIMKDDIKDADTVNKAVTSEYLLCIIELCEKLKVGDARRTLLLKLEESRIHVIDIYYSFAMLFEYIKSTDGDLAFHEYNNLISLSYSNNTNNPLSSSSLSTILPHFIHTLLLSINHNTNTKVINTHNNSINHLSSKTLATSGLKALSLIIDIVEHHFTLLRQIIPGVFSNIIQFLRQSKSNKNAQNVTLALVLLLRLLRYTCGDSLSGNQRVLELVYSDNSTTEMENSPIKKILESSSNQSSSINHEDKDRVTQSDQRLLSERITLLQHVQMHFPMAFKDGLQNNLTSKHLQRIVHEIILLLQESFKYLGVHTCIQLLMTIAPYMDSLYKIPNDQSDHSNPVEDEILVGTPITTEHDVLLRQVLLIIRTRDMQFYLKFINQLKFHYQKLLLEDSPGEFEEYRERKSTQSFFLLQQLILLQSLFTAEELTIIFQIHREKILERFYQLYHSQTVIPTNRILKGQDHPNPLKLMLLETRRYSTNYDTTTDHQRITGRKYLDLEYYQYFQFPFENTRPFGVDRSDEYSPERLWRLFARQLMSINSIARIFLQYHEKVIARLSTLSDKLLRVKPSTRITSSTSTVERSDLSSEEVLEVEKLASQALVSGFFLQEGILQGLYLKRTISSISTDSNSNNSSNSCDGIDSNIKERRVCQYCQESHPSSHTQDGSKLLRCARCKVTYYCSSEHQKLHWAVHKKICKVQNSNKSSKNTDSNTIPTTTSSNLKHEKKVEIFSVTEEAKFKSINSRDILRYPFSLKETHMNEIESLQFQRTPVHPNKNNTSNSISNSNDNSSSSNNNSAKSNSSNSGTFADAVLVSSIRHLRVLLSQLKLANYQYHHPKDQLVKHQQEEQLHRHRSLVLLNLLTVLTSFIMELVADYAFGYTRSKFQVHLIQCLYPLLESLAMNSTRSPLSSTTSRSLQPTNSSQLIITGQSDQLTLLTKVAYSSLQRIAVYLQYPSTTIGTPLSTITTAVDNGDSTSQQRGAGRDALAWMVREELDYLADEIIQRLKYPKHQYSHRYDKLTTNTTTTTSEVVSVTSSLNLAYLNSAHQVLAIILRVGHLHLFEEVDTIESSTTTTAITSTRPSRQRENQLIRDMIHAAIDCFDQSIHGNKSRLSRKSTNTSNADIPSNTINMIGHWRSWLTALLLLIENQKSSTNSNFSNSNSNNNDNSNKFSESHQQSQHTNIHQKIFSTLVTFDERLLALGNQRGSSSNPEESQNSTNETSNSSNEEDSSASSSSSGQVMEKLILECAHRGAYVLQVTPQYFHLSRESHSIHFIHTQRLAIAVIYASLRQLYYYQLQVQAQRQHGLLLNAIYQLWPALCKKLYAVIGEIVGSPVGHSSGGKVVKSPGLVEVTMILSDIFQPTVNYHESNNNSSSNSSGNSSNHLISLQDLLMKTTNNNSSDNIQHTDKTATSDKLVRDEFIIRESHHPRDIKDRPITHTPASMKSLTPSKRQEFLLVTDLLDCAQELCNFHREFNAQRCARDCIPIALILLFAHSQYFCHQHQYRPLQGKKILNSIENTLKLKLLQILERCLFNNEEESGNSASELNRSLRELISFNDVMKPMIFLLMPLIHPDEHPIILERTESIFMKVIRKERIFFNHVIESLGEVNTQQENHSILSMSVHAALTLEEYLTNLQFLSIQSSSKSTVIFIQSILNNSLVQISRDKKHLTYLLQLSASIRSTEMDMKEYYLLFAQYSAMI